MRLTTSGGIVSIVWGMSCVMRFLDETYGLVVCHADGQDYQEGRFAERVFMLKVAAVIGEGC